MSVQGSTLSEVVPNTGRGRAGAVTEPLTCPQCVEEGVPTSCRIGSRKTFCRTCNRFAQAVRRELLVRLRDRFPEESDRLRFAVERELYLNITESRKGHSMRGGTL